MYELKVNEFSVHMLLLVIVCFVCKELFYLCFTLKLVAILTLGHNACVIHIGIVNIFINLKQLTNIDMLEITRLVNVFYHSLKLTERHVSVNYTASQGRS